MNKFRKFLGMLEDEVDSWQYSDELRDLFHELCKEHSCGEFSPEKVREKIRKEREEVVRSKNLLCPNCEKSSKRFTPEGLFNHFITTHEVIEEYKFKSNPNQIERQDYGIKYFPEYTSVENPSRSVLSKFTTEELRFVVSNFNGRI